MNDVCYSKLQTKPSAPEHNDRRGQHCSSWTLLSPWLFSTIMNARRIRYRIFPCRLNRRWSILALVLIVYFLICHLPGPPATQNNTRADRPPPKHRVDEQPHFLYRSPFRQNPDLEYEKRLSDDLQKLEQEALTRHGRSNIAENRIWQIAQDEDHRGSDSISFEKRNTDWMYTVS